MVKERPVTDIGNFLSNKEDLSEKEMLLAIVNCEDKNVPFISPEKAKRILKMKYGVKI